MKSCDWFGYSGGMNQPQAMALLERAKKSGLGGKEKISLQKVSVIWNREEWRACLAAKGVARLSNLADAFADLDIGLVGLIAGKRVAVIRHSRDVPPEVIENCCKELGYSWFVFGLHQAKTVAGDHLVVFSNSHFAALSYEEVSRPIPLLGEYPTHQPTEPADGAVGVDFSFRPGSPISEIQPPIEAVSLKSHTHWEEMC